MKKNGIKKLVTSIVLVMTICGGICLADNPIIQTRYTADPAPMVYDGVCYVYTSHDEDVIVRDFFSMNDWRCYSTTDMVNWTDLGSPLSYENFKWAGSNSSWAGQCIPRNGKFYYYVPINQKRGGNAIGVAVSDSPVGPFSDPLGKPLLSGVGYIDPTVFIDDDGQAYLYWGNPQEVEGTLNPAAVRGPDGRLYLFPRLVAKGNYSRIGIARVRFNEAGDPSGIERLGIALEPEADYERLPDGSGGCEDPRVTFVEPLQRYIMTYTAISPEGPRIALAVSKDLFSWQRMGLATFEPYQGIDFVNVGNKDASVFPIAIPNHAGKMQLAMLHRGRNRRFGGDQVFFY